DGGDQGPYLVRGERAPALLQSALSADAIGLREGSGLFSLLLDEEGKTLDRVACLRLRKGPFDEPRYLLRASAAAAVEAAEWLRALSDGYVDFGAPDPFAKVEGPAVVEEALWTSFALAGPTAGAVLKKAGVPLAGQGSAGPGEAVALRLADDAFEVLVPVAGAAGAWKALKEAGAKPAGVQTRDALAAKGKVWGVRAGEPRATLGEAAAGAPAGAVFAGKTSFVGMAKASGAPRGEALPPFAWKAPELPLRRTPLYEEHLKHTKKRNLVPFAGWEMPVVYTSIGDEHRTVRERAGLFDVGHMGVFEASGPNAARFLDLVTTNYVPRLTVGESHYSYLLDPDANCIDDLMIYRVEPQRFLLVVNASNAEKDWAWLTAYNEGRAMLDRERPWARIDAPAVLRDLKDPASGADRRIDLALQGPRSIDTLLALARNPEEAEGLKVLARNHNLRADLGGVDTIVSRTGYTGEDYGYEIYVHPDQAARLWNLILEKGRAFGVQPTGLGARDSTRTEAGLPLYGHDLEGRFKIDPIEAGYGYFVKFHKPFFAGRGPLLARMLKRDRAVVRFQARGLGARVANLGDPVVNRNGKAIGHVTSSALVGEDQIGLAIVEKAAAVENSPVSIYCIPRAGEVPEEGNKKALKPGDKVLLPMEARVVSRFPKRK
ncbi:MAG: glycine cleavage system aminomethyltransferase GcvT, partial [Planctomycetes bacterium]|nr:glycine cleavage system aminomethyltransferase GcvT [Planctomycetota bacterium]